MMGTGGAGGTCRSVHLVAQVVAQGRGFLSDPARAVELQGPREGYGMYRHTPCKYGILPGRRAVGAAAAAVRAQAGASDRADSAP